MKDQFKRVLDLVRKTGDTMVVTDPNGEDVYVVMDIDHYELLLDVHHDMQILDETLEDDWDEEEFDAPAELASIWETMQAAGEEGKTWDLAKLSEDEIQDLESKYQEFANRNVEEAIIEGAKGAEGEKVEKDEDFGEEAFYLEPIE